MNRILRILLILIFFNPLLRGLGQNQEEGKDTLVQLARKFVTFLVEEDFEGAVKNFDETMSRVSPPGKLKEVWELVLGQVGPFQKQLRTRTESVSRYDIVYVTCAFEKQTLDIKVVFNSDKKIAGQFFVPTQAPAEYKAPSYVRPKDFFEKDVVIGKGEWELPGTLTLPRMGEPFPVVVLVHGSGPQDRDETIGPNKPFRDLAWGLASQDIAVLRYEKRTKAHNKTIAGDKNLRFTVKEETIDDCLEAVKIVRKNQAIDAYKIFVLGHSLGATLIPRIAERDSGITGFIFLAGATRNLEDIFLEQLKYIFSLDGQISDTEQNQLDETQRLIEKIQRLKTTDIETHREILLGAYPEYWLDLRGYSPAESAKAISQPQLFLQGGRDYQVTEKDFKAWKTALSSRKDVRFKLYPTLNHLFISGTGKSTPAEYQRAGHIAPSVIDDIAAWIKNRSIR